MRAVCARFGVDDPRLSAPSALLEIPPELLALLVLLIDVQPEAKALFLFAEAVGQRFAAPHPARQLGLALLRKARFPPLQMSYETPPPARPFRPRHFFHTLAAARFFRAARAKTPSPALQIPLVHKEIERQLTFEPRRRGQAAARLRAASSSSTASWRTRPAKARPPKRPVRAPARGAQSESPRRRRRASHFHTGARTATCLSPYKCRGPGTAYTSAPPLRSTRANSCGNHGAEHVEHAMERGVPRGMAKLPATAHLDGFIPACGRLHRLFRDVVGGDARRTARLPERLRHARGVISLAAARIQPRPVCRRPPSPPAPSCASASANGA